MLILGIDSSGANCTAAISKDNQIIDSFAINSGKSHSECLLPNIEAMLNKNDIKINMLDRIAISCGPGSYTGLRIGIATVKGLAIANDIPCISLSTLEALCYNYPFKENSVISAMLDARRNEFYQAFFTVKNSKIIRLTEDRSILIDELISESEKYNDLYVIGDGAAKFIKLSKMQCNAFGDQTDLGSGISVCKAAYENKDNILSCRELKPSYLKLAQAERELNNKCEVKK